MDSKPTTLEKPTLTVQAFWLMVAKTVGFGLGIALPVILVRVFDRSQYGIFRQAFVVITTAYSMLSMGVGISAFYYLPRMSVGRARVVLNIVVFHLVSGLVPFAVLVFYPQVLARLFGGPELLPYASLIGAVMLLTIFSSFLENIATALQDVRSSTVFIVLAQFSKVILMTAAALILRSIEGLLWAAVAQGLLQSGILLWYLRDRFGAFWKAWDWPFFREQMAYALPYGLYGLLSTAQSDLHNFFVAHAFGPGAFAIYAIGCMQIPLLTLLRDSINAVLITRISELQQRGETREIVLTMIRAMRKTALIYLPSCALLAVLGRPLIVFVYTADYEASWPIFGINLLMLPILVFMTDPVVRAYPQHRYFVVQVRIALVALQCIVLWLAVRSIGLTGAVSVVVIVAALERLIVTLRVASILHVRLADLRLFGGIVRIGLVSAAAGLAAWLLRAALGGTPPVLLLALCSAVFALVFLGLMVAFGLFEPEERELLRSRLVRLRGAATGAGL
ncbi:MAG TPA: oligosaccharide flippase family protein [Bryobacteraceae bacterium]|nr:oligosaccharide flippase family protein [Bryobacteraceae bacterium]